MPSSSRQYFLKHKPAGAMITKSPYTFRNQYRIIFGTSTIAIPLSRAFLFPTLRHNCGCHTMKCDRYWHTQAALCISFRKNRLRTNTYIHISRLEQKISRGFPELQANTVNYFWISWHPFRLKNPTRTRWRAFSSPDFQRHICPQKLALKSVSICSLAELLAGWKGIFSPFPPMASNNHL